MKKNMILMVLSLLVMAHSSYALKFQVINKTSSPYIDTDPVWRGNVRAWYRVQKSMSYDSASNNLEKMRWKIGKECWQANVENAIKSFVNYRTMRWPVLIYIYDGGSYSLDFENGRKERPQGMADKSNC